MNLELLECRISQLPGCLLAGLLGVFIDVSMISLIVLYKAPVMLLKGWGQLIQDLLGRSGPFLESVCVPFAGLLILLWPLAVLLASAAGIFSSLFLGCYAPAVVYQVQHRESSSCRMYILLERKYLFE